MRDKLIEFIDKNIYFLIIIFGLFLVGSTKCSGQDTTGVGEMIRAYDIKHPDIVLRQATFESGWWNPTLKSSWNSCNNTFGFFYKGKYLKFDNMEHCIEYYNWWQDQLYTGGDYYEFLERVGFATAPNYINELKRMW